MQHGLKLASYEKQPLKEAQAGVQVGWGRVLPSQQSGVSGIQQFNADSDLVPAAVCVKG